MFMILIVGCGFQSGRDGPPVSAPFVATGTEGIVMQFIPDQPPAKVYTGSPLLFVIEVRNRGTYTVQNAAFYLTGHDPGMIFMNPPGVHMLQQPLESKSVYNSEGGYDTIEFQSTRDLNLFDMPNYKPTFLLTACYQYQTIATPLICIDSNPLDTTSDKACRVQSVYSTGSQGAPVAVQSVEAEARPGGMFFRIHISNTGGGEGGTGTVFDLSALNLCPASLEYRDLNTLEYDVSISGQPLDCDPQGSLRLVNGRTTLFCRYQNMLQIPAYQTPLEITLTYGYKNSISKIVEIENIDFGR